MPLINSPRKAGLTEELFHWFIGHFQSTLEEFEFPEEKIKQVIAITDKHKDEVLNRKIAELM